MVVESSDMCVCIARQGDGSFVERLDNCSSQHSYVCAEGKMPFSFLVHLKVLKREIYVFVIVKIGYSAVSNYKYMVTLFKNLTKHAYNVCSTCFKILVFKMGVNLCILLLT
jgi:hypothetical protein